MKSLAVEMTHKGANIYKSSMWCIMVEKTRFMGIDSQRLFVALFYKPLRGSAISNSMRRS